MKVPGLHLPPAPVRHVSSVRRQVVPVHVVACDGAKVPLRLRPSRSWPLASSPGTDGVVPSRPHRRRLLPDPDSQSPLLSASALQAEKGHPLLPWESSVKCAGSLGRPSVRAPTGGRTALQRLERDVLTGRHDQLGEAGLSRSTRMRAPRRDGNRGADLLGPEAPGLRGRRDDRERGPDCVAHRDRVTARRPEGAA
jgi:hypothetical protein